MKRSPLVDAIKALFVGIESQCGVRVVVIRIVARSQVAAEEAVRRVRRDLPAEHVITECNIIAPVKKDGRSMGNRRRIVIRAKRASPGHYLAVPNWRHAMRHAWAASQERALAPPNPRKSPSPEDREAPTTSSKS